VKLIGDRLIAGQTVTDSDVGLGEAIGAVGIGAAQTVGTAASVAISAPIAVFDPRTRENYGRQVERLGRSVENTVGSVGDTATSVVDPQLLDSGSRSKTDCSLRANRNNAVCRSR